MDVVVNKYLVRIHSVDGDTISTVALTDYEYCIMTDIFTCFNSEVFHRDSAKDSLITYFERAFDTRKEAIQYYKDHKDEIEWKAFSHASKVC